MVPEFVRRRYSTMFNGHPPFAHEHTDDRQDFNMAAWCESPPDAFRYHERPLEGFPPHPGLLTSAPRASSPDKQQDDGVRPHNTVPALFSSPKLSPVKIAELEQEHDRAELQKLYFPPLPELVDDDGTEFATSFAEPSSSDEGSPHKDIPHNTFLRCRQCDCLLKWVLGEESKSGVREIHQCKPACTSAGHGRIGHRLADGPVQVSRGAW